MIRIGLFEVNDLFWNSFRIFRVFFYYKIIICKNNSVILILRFIIMLCYFKCNDFMFIVLLIWEIKYWF